MLGLQFLFTCMLNYKQDAAVAQKAADALNDIMTIKEFPNELQATISKFIPQLISMAGDVQISLYFDVVLDIVKNIDISDYIVSLVQEFTNRILMVFIENLF